MIAKNLRLSWGKISENLPFRVKNLWRFVKKIFGFFRNRFPRISERNLSFLRGKFRSISIEDCRFSMVKVSKKFQRKSSGHFWINFEKFPKKISFFSGISFEGFQRKYPGFIGKNCREFLQKIFQYLDNEFSMIWKKNLPVSLDKIPEDSGRESLGIFGINFQPISMNFNYFRDNVDRFPKKIFGFLRKHFPKISEKDL